MGVECSIIVPLRNNREGLFRLNQRLEVTLRGLAMPYEIIYVDDGSDDGAATDIQMLHEENAAVRGILLSRSFGREAAVWAGLEAACGRAIVVLDGDLRQPPEIIPELVASWQHGHHVVRGRPRSREDAAGQATTMLHWLLPIGRLHRCLIAHDSMLLVDRNVLRHLMQIRQHDRRIDDLCRWAGFQQTTVEYNVHGWPLDRGRAPWFQAVSAAIGRKWRMMRPLGAGAVGRLGLIVVALTMLGFVIGAAAWLAGHLWSFQVWIALAIAGVAGMNLTAMGVLAEYLTRACRETDARPLYITRERLGIRPHPRLVPNVLDWIDEERTAEQELATTAAAEDRLTRLAPPGTIN